MSDIAGKYVPSVDTGWNGEPDIGKNADPSALIHGSAAAIAREISAREFGIFLAFSQTHGTRLLATVDSAYPSLSITSRLLSAMDGGELACRVQNSTKPFWWAAGPDSSLRTLRWADQIMPPIPGVQGIAFPVYDEASQAGIVLFTGDHIELDDPSLAVHHARCFSLFASCAEARRPQSHRLPEITKRERECLSLTANGHTSEEIAAMLGLSVHTANQHIARMTEKLDATNRMHAVAKALRLGMID